MKLLALTLRTPTDRRAWSSASDLAPLRPWPRAEEEEEEEEEDAEQEDEEEEEEE